MLQLVKLVISIFIFFGGFGKYVSGQYYPEPPTNFDIECGAILYIDPKDYSKQYLYATNEDVIYYTRRGSREEEVFFCIYVNQRTQECRDESLWFWHDAKLTRKISKPAKQGDWFFKFNILVLDPIFTPGVTVNYNVDIHYFYFPSYSVYFNNEKNLKVLFNFNYGDYVQLDEFPFFVNFVDENDKCREYRPKVLQYNEVMNFNLFLNRKWTEFAYYFIKKDKYVCAYSLKYMDIFKGNIFNDIEIHHVGFNLIDNYPTENYAPNFFCVDPLYGTFVSLYWNQQQPNASPEAHYYIINENDIKNIQLIDRLVLKDFDKNVLKDIFENVFDREYLPTFVSYGRTIFIWFKRQSESRAFNGFWTNESVFDVYFEEIDKDRTLRKIFRSKKEYIQVDRPVGRMEVHVTPKPITLFPTTQPPQTTLPPQTTTQLSTTTTESSPSTLSTTSSTTSEQTTEETTEQSTTTTTLTATSTSTESYEMSTSGSNGHKAAAQTSNSDDCQYETYLWILIAFICVDVVLGIVLGILIAFKFRGAKKMKEAMKKRYAKPGPKKLSKKPVLKEKKLGMPWKKKQTEDSKMSTKEKSVTTKTEDAAGGDKTVEANKKTTTTVNQTTDYYTVNENFDKK